MEKGRRFFYLLRMAAEAHARWEIESANDILRNRKKLLILLALSLPALGFVGYSFAAGTDFLGGKEAYAPSFYSNFIFFVSIFIGLCAGLITGCIGAGGGFVITPALMSAGVKGILAVGTDLFHIFAKAIMGTAVHRKLGNVSVKLAIVFLVGSTVGVVVGGTINRAIYDYNPVMSDLFISLVYVFLLGFLGIYAMTDFFRLRAAGRQTKIVAPSGPAPAPTAAATTGLAQKLQSVQIPPMISFDEDVVPGGNKIAGIFVVICGFIVGLTASIMGVGGGFLTFPMFVYLLGVSSFTTVGTDILQIIITAGFGAISQYAIYGFIFYTLAMGMLLGSLLGIQVGALTTKVVKGIYIRGFYAITILAGFINRIFALPKKLNQMEYISISKGLAGWIDFLGAIIFFAMVAIFGIWVFFMFFKNIDVLRGKEALSSEAGGGGH
jgi:uncharacterized membrane protein YfcA